MRSRWQWIASWARANKEVGGLRAGGQVTHAIAGVGHAPALGLERSHRSGLPAAARIVAGTFVGELEFDRAVAEQNSRLDWNWHVGQSPARAEHGPDVGVEAIADDLKRNVLRPRSVGDQRRDRPGSMACRSMSARNSCSLARTSANCRRARWLVGISPRIHSSSMSRQVESAKASKMT